MTARDRADVPPAGTGADSPTAGGGPDSPVPREGAANGPPSGVAAPGARVARARRARDDRAEPGAAPLASSTAAALGPLRERIDAIDHEIVALLDERARIALEIGQAKQATGRRTVRDAAREAEVLEHVSHASAGLLPEPELIALYRKLIAATRRVQHAQRRGLDPAAARPAGPQATLDGAPAAAEAVPTRPIEE